MTKDCRTRDNLLDAALALMLAKGFGATSVEKICDSAGVTKGCFFYHFKSKEELACATLDRFFEGTQQMFREASFRTLSDPLERVYGYVDFAIECSQSPMARHGCLIGNFAQELSDSHERIRLKCEAHFAEVVQSLQKDLSEAVLLHSPGSGVDVHGLAEHFVAVMQGALILAKTRQDAAVVKESLNHFKLYLKSIFE